MVASPGTPAPVRAAYAPARAQDRVASALIAIAVTLLFVWLLATLGLFDAGQSGRQAGALSTFSFSTGERAQATAADKADQPQAKASKETPVERPPRQATPKPAIVPPPPIAPTAPVPWIQIGREELASVDSAMTTPHPGRRKASSASADAGGGAGSAGAAGDSRRVGTGPSGDALYAADWYRRPTHAEMAYYVPPDLPDGAWGEIACRTAPQYRVVDCVPLGEAPGGTGLARKLVEAAWQFRVQPPRVNRRPLVGEWVRIHFDFSVQGRGR